MRTCEDLAEVKSMALALAMWSTKANPKYFNQIGLDDAVSYLTVSRKQILAFEKLPTIHCDRAFRIVVMKEVRKLLRKYEKKK